jgi:hypothetical protein
MRETTVNTKTQACEGSHWFLRYSQHVALGFLAPPWRFSILVHAKQCRCSRVVRDSIAYEEDQRSVLQFTCLDSFVVRGVVVGWGLLCMLGIYWGLLRPYSASTILLAAAVGCIANWIKNRTHCCLTGSIAKISSCGSARERRLEGAFFDSSKSARKSWDACSSTKVACKT